MPIEMMEFESIRIIDNIDRWTLQITIKSSSLDSLAICQCVTTQIQSRKGHIAGIKKLSIINVIYTSTETGIDVLGSD